MQVEDRYLVGNSKVRSLCVSSMSGESILVGCDDGSVHIIGENVPNRVVGLFELDGPASALRVVGQDLHIQQGWERKVVSWKGEKKHYLLDSFSKSGHGGSETRKYAVLAGLGQLLGTCPSSS